MGTQADSPDGSQGLLARTDGSLTPAVTRATLAGRIPRPDLTPYRPGIVSESQRNSQQDSAQGRECCERQQGESKKTQRMNVNAVIQGVVKQNIVELSGPQTPSDLVTTKDDHGRH